MAEQLRRETGVAWDTSRSLDLEPDTHNILWLRSQREPFRGDPGQRSHVCLARQPGRADRVPDGTTGALILCLRIEAHRGCRRTVSSVKYSVKRGRGRAG
jgi:hypothetical protein